MSTAQGAEPSAAPHGPPLPARLRQARLAAGLSLDELTERLRSPVSKQALSKYERGEARPLPTRLIDLAEALNVDAAWLLTTPSVAVSWVAYRAHHALTQERRKEVTARAEQRLESELWLRSLFSVGPTHDVPTNLEVETLDAAERAAERVREAWGLGDAPVANVMETLEARGVVVMGFSADAKFDGLSGWANEHVPVIVVNSARSMDRIRFDAAHELGHLCVASTATPKAQESFAHRFAAAFLVPRSAVQRELGARRSALSIPEMGLLKRQWGLSMQAWFRRAKDLDVIGYDHYVSLNTHFRRRGWHLQEPYVYEGDETPALLRRLTWRGLAEHVLTDHDAHRVLPELDLTPEATLLDVPVSLRDLAERPLSERDAAIAARPPIVELDEVSEWDALGTPDVAEG